MLIREELQDLYRGAIKKVGPHLAEYNAQSKRGKPKATHPFLLDISNDFNTAKPSVMIFGQETNTWHDEFPALHDLDLLQRELQNTYCEFYLEGGIRRYPGPFWNEFKRICNTINKGRKPSQQVNFIWNNINKIGIMGKGHHGPLDRIQFDFFNVVRDEIRILKPNLMVFLTGPNYDEFITKNMAVFAQKPICDEISELLFSGEFQGLKSYKTYHPNRLYFMKRNREVIPKMIDLIYSTIEQGP